jgi:transcriptional regulator with XRE-family HTH domain
MVERLNNIAKIRRSRGLSQQQLADLVGAHVITISNLERGKAYLTNEWLTKIADALQIDEDALLVTERTYKVWVDGEIEANYIQTAYPNQNRTVAYAAYFPDTPAHFPIWLRVRDNSLYPLFRASDLVRLVEISQIPEHIQLATGRLCVVKTREKHVYVGHVVGSGSLHGTINFNPIAGPAMRDILPSAIFLIDRALYAPSYDSKERFPEISG